MNIFGRKKNNNNSEKVKQTQTEPEQSIEDIRARKEQLISQLQATINQEELQIKKNPTKNREAFRLLQERAAAQEAKALQAQVEAQAQINMRGPGPAPVQGYGNNPHAYAVSAEKLQADTAIGSYLITIYEQFPLSPSQKQAILTVIDEKAPWYLANLRAVAAAAAQEARSTRAPVQNPAATETPSSVQIDENLLEDVMGTGAGGQ